ncbi:MAG: SDR family NAD(P)-dependent oxidoreductase [Kiloniellales bacterium]
MDNPRAILITGASSGIGAALARVYAAPGVYLALGGRDAGRLDAVAEACRAAGAEAEGTVTDVTDRVAMDDWITAVDASHPLDLVIANAGISAGTGGGGETDEQARRIFATNVDGVAHTVWPALERMTPRGAGQIALMSSLAGFRGFPGAPAYCASKAAVRVWGEALRGNLATSGIGVTVICPGYVRSPMTAVNDFPMPFIMDADRVAAIIRRGLAHNRARLMFPWPLAASTWLLWALPPGWVDPLLRRMPEKKSN